jgi:hypothetical protein
VRKKKDSEKIKFIEALLKKEENDWCLFSHFLFFIYFKYLKNRKIFYCNIKVKMI